MSVVLRPTPDHPTVAVLCAAHRPPGMDEVERSAHVRYVTAPGLAGALRGADALFVWDFSSTAVVDAWSAADRLRWVHVAGTGVENLLFPELVAGDVVLTNSRGVFDQAIAEYVLALVLAHAKDLPTTLALQAERIWRHRETQTLADRPVLVIGTGGIGRAIGRLLSAVGMRVTGVGRRARTDDPDLGAVHDQRRLHDLLPGADVVVLAAPLTAQTRGMIDAAAFARMRPGVQLINVGRGPLVVENALLNALHTGRIGAVALDVFDREPLPAHHPLWTTPGVLISPHMSGDFVGWLDVLAARFVENFRRWRSGEPLVNVVDKTLGYVPADDSVNDDSVTGGVVDGVDSVDTVDDVKGAVAP